MSQPMSVAIVGGSQATPARDSNTLPEITPRLKVAVDWITITFSSNMTRALVESWLLSIVPGEFTEAGHGLDGYEAMTVGPGGAKVLTSSKLDTVRVILPGEWCKAVALPDIKELIQGVIECEGEFRRVDLACDDYQADYTVESLYNRAREGELVTHAQRKNITLLQNLAGGQTFMVGSRSSRQVLRVYDKSAESLGLIEAIRWEIEAKREAATSLAACILLTENLGQVWMERLVGIADFRNNDDSNTTRRTRSAWFQELVGLATKAQAYPVKPVKLLIQVKNWLEHQISCSLALVVKAEGDGWNWLANILESGEARWKPRHHVLLAQAGLSPSLSLA